MILQQVFYRKVKDGYEAFDNEGNSAFGKTKEAAYNQYFIKHNSDVLVGSNNKELLNDIMKGAKL